LVIDTSLGVYLKLQSLELKSFVAYELNIGSPAGERGIDRGDTLLSELIVLGNGCCDSIDIAFECVGQRNQFRLGINDARVTLAVAVRFRGGTWLDVLPPHPHLP